VLELAAMRAVWSSGPDRKSGVALSCEQLFELSRVRARHVEQLQSASRPRYQADRVAADAERRSHRGQTSCGRLAIHGSLSDPDDQGSVVFPAHTGMGRSGPHPDGNTHLISVPRLSPSAGVGS
jgi:hypothetical protein